MSDQKTWIAPLRNGQFIEILTDDDVGTEVPATMNNRNFLSDENFMDDNDDNDDNDDGHEAPQKIVTNTDDNDNVTSTMEEEERKTIDEQPQEQALDSAKSEPGLFHGSTKGMKLYKHVQYSQVNELRNFPLNHSKENALYVLSHSPSTKVFRMRKMTKYCVRPYTHNIEHCIHCGQPEEFDIVHTMPTESDGVDDNCSGSHFFMFVFDPSKNQNEVRQRAKNEYRKVCFENWNIFDYCLGEPKSNYNDDIKCNPDKDKNDNLFNYHFDKLIELQRNIDIILQPGCGRSLSETNELISDAS